MAMTHDELRAMLAHPAVNLDWEGLSLTTGLDRRNARRLGTRPEQPIPEALENWLRETIRANRPRPRIADWIARREGSHPPPRLGRGVHALHPPGQAPRARAPRFQNHPLRKQRPEAAPAPARSETAANRRAHAFFKGSKV